MFENMSPREKMLVWVVGATLPIVVLFMAFFWFMDRYDANDAKIDELTAKVEEQDDKLERGKNASSRRNYYRKTSLPSAKSRTLSIYISWLYDVVEKECKMTFNGPKPKAGGTLAYERGTTIASRNAFTIRPKGTLEQLTQFLHIFYSADHLHRINKLSVKPIGKEQRGKPPVLTGELQLEIEIETLSMQDGPDDIASFPVWQRQLPTMDQYTDRIMARNVFGPANNKPVLKKPARTEFTHVKTEKDALGKYETITLSVTDADKGDLLSFELIEESGQDDFGVVLDDQPRSSEVRRISLRVPKQAKPVRIPVKVRVTDSGLPAKSDEVRFTIVYSKPKERKAKKKIVKADEETLIRVIGLIRGGDGRWVARLHDSRKLRSDEYAEGDAIKLDSKEWTLVEITKKIVTFDVDGEKKSFKGGSSLDQPLDSM